MEGIMLTIWLRQATCRRVFHETISQCFEFPASSARPHVQQPPWPKPLPPTPTASLPAPYIRSSSKFSPDSRPARQTPSPRPPPDDLKPRVSPNQTSSSAAPSPKKLTSLSVITE